MDEKNKVKIIEIDTCEICDCKIDDSNYPTNSAYGFLCPSCMFKLAYGNYSDESSDTGY